MENEIVNFNDDRLGPNVYVRVQFLFGRSKVSADSNLKYQLVSTKKNTIIGRLGTRRDSVYVWQFWLIYLDLAKQHLNIEDLIKEYLIVLINFFSSSQWNIFNYL